MRHLFLIFLPLSLMACVEEIGGPGRGYTADKTMDRGFDRKPLRQLQAGIWIDPNGCDHWIIDDGVEGYLSARLDPYGRPVCSGAAGPRETVGDFKQGSIFRDPN